jgi:hypothetical protein
VYIYTDDKIITGPETSSIDKAIVDIASLFDITSKETVSDFLRVNIDCTSEDRFTLTQPKLIATILSDLGLKEDSNTLPIPAVSSRILHAHVDSTPYAEQWHYRSIIGKLNFLAQSTRPDISNAFHQCARFSEHPMKEHSKAIKAIGRYLAVTMNIGIIVMKRMSALNLLATRIYPVIGTKNWLNMIVRLLDHVLVIYYGMRVVLSHGDLNYKQKFL